MNVEIDITNVTLKTERLFLRPFEENDLKDLNEYAKVPGVGERAGWKHHESVEESKRILDMFIDEKKVLAITINNKVIGSIGIEKYKEDNLPMLQPFSGREIGFVLSKDYWGNGYVTEAAKAVMDYCFDYLQLDFLVCGYFPDNLASKRVQEKLGFKYVKNSVFKTSFGEEKAVVVNICCKTKEAELAVFGK